MNRPRRLGFVISILCQSVWLPLSVANGQTSPPEIVRIDPPEHGFFAKRLDYRGIPIKAHAAVADEALFEARRRLQRMLGHIPTAAANLRTERVELHIIGKDQVTSDLPEHRPMKGRPFEGELDIDQRTRGVGGLLASCGEENLLRLPGDRYAGRDICVHEFAHTLLAFGVSDAIRRRVADQHRRSTGRGLWKAAYAGTNDDEYFAELTMWYFGTRGDYGQIEPEPEPGRPWLERYDPEGFALLDDLYSGRLEIARTRLVTLEPLPPDREGTLTSADAETPTRLRLDNQTDGEVQLFWLDYQGKRQKYASIPPGGRDSRETFARHVWLATDSEGRGLSIFIAQPEDGIGTIKESRCRRAHRPIQSEK